MAGIAIEQPDRQGSVLMFRALKLIKLTFLFLIAAVAINAAGGKNDVSVKADYDGDGVIDNAFWRPATGNWYISLAADDGDAKNVIVKKWGKRGDTPVPADYDGDGKADLAFFRPGENGWYIMFSSTENWRVFTLGDFTADLLVPADYDGDGKAEPAVYSRGRWQRLNIDTGEIEPLVLGFDDDRPAPGDYDGDGTIDFAVKRAGTYFIYESTGPRFRTARFSKWDQLPKNMPVVRDPRKF